VTGGTSGIQPPRFDGTNGRKLNNSTSFTQPFTPPKLTLPPRYGVTVVASPPPTVRLYVSDVPNRNDDNDDDDDARDKQASAKTKFNSVGPEGLPTPSSEPLSSGVDVAAGSGSSEGTRVMARVSFDATNCASNPSQLQCSSRPNDRKFSTTGGGDAATTSGTKPEAAASDVTWLKDRQVMTIVTFIVVIYFIFFISVLGYIIGSVSGEERETSFLFAASVRFNAILLHDTFLCQEDPDQQLSQLSFLLLLTFWNYSLHQGILNFFYKYFGVYVFNKKRVRKLRDRDRHSKNNQDTYRRH